MIDFTPLFELLKKRRLHRWVEKIPKDLEISYNHGQFIEWANELKRLPNVSPSFINLSSDVIKIGSPSDLQESEAKIIYEILQSAMPWRKGPFNLFGTYIDSEWRSDFKWNRLKNHIQPLENKNVLDVGCGNGYHCFRMAAHNPKAIIGVDPSIRNLFQFAIFKKYTPQLPIWLIPIGLEQIPENISFFDTVFSMGVLYHRRSPIDHLFNLKGAMKDGAELVLETLIIDGKLGESLVPEDRYASMRNVYFIPTVLTLESWLKKVGFKNIRTIDITPTTLDEQRKTDWMEYSSLENALNSNNSNLTIEGHPAPKRAIVIATK